MLITEPPLLRQVSISIFKAGTRARGDDFRTVKGASRRIAVFEKEGGNLPSSFGFYCSITRKRYGLSGTSLYEKPEGLGDPARLQSNLFPYITGQFCNSITIWRIRQRYFGQYAYIVNIPSLMFETGLPVSQSILHRSDGGYSFHILRSRSAFLEL